VGLAFADAIDASVEFVILLHWRISIADACCFVAILIAVKANTITFEFWLSSQ
jgi:hypothetical protein